MSHSKSARAREWTNAGPTTQTQIAAAPFAPRRAGRRALSQLTGRSRLTSVDINRNSLAPCVPPRKAFGIDDDSGGTVFRLCPWRRARRPGAAGSTSRRIAPFHDDAVHARPGRRRPAVRRRGRTSAGSTSRRTRGSTPSAGQGANVRLGAPREGALRREYGAGWVMRGIGHRRPKGRARWGLFKRADRAPYRVVASVSSTYRPGLVAVVGSRRKCRDTASLPHKLP